MSRVKNCVGNSISEAMRSVVWRFTKYSESGMEICSQKNETGTCAVIVSEIVAKDSSSDGAEHVCDACLKRQRLSANWSLFIGGEVRCLCNTQLEIYFLLHVFLHTLGCLCATR